MASISGTQSPVNTGSYGAGGSSQGDLNQQIDDVKSKINQMESQGSQGGQGSGGAGGGESLEDLKELLKKLLAQLQQQGAQGGQGGEGGQGNGQIPQPDYQGGGSINT